MEDIIEYVRGFAEAFIVVVSPFAYKLYKELLKLRKSDTQQKEKLAYFKGKYTEKVVLKSHGKKSKRE